MRAFMVFITVLSVTVSLHAIAQEDDFDREFELLEEEDIVFTAAKHQQDITESPSAITVITREQIENTHCTDVVCLLRQVPEVDVRRTLPAFTVVGARALTEDFGNRALVLIDGLEINIEFIGIAIWQTLYVHLEDIERIEVIRGPGSALYGANAHSIVVSIITRRAKEGGAEIFLGSGEHDRSSLHIRLNQSLGNWRLHLSGGLDTQGHWQIPDDRQREAYRVNLRLEHETDSATSILYLGFVKPYGWVYTQLAPAEGTEGGMGHAFLSHRTDLIRAQLSWKFSTSTFFVDMPLYWEDTKLGELPVVSFFDSNLDADVQLTWSPFEGNLLIGGANYRWFTLISDDVTQRTTHQHRVGLFLHDEQRFFESLVVTAGIRLDFNTITPLAISPRLAGVWSFTENQSLRLAFGQAFRKPSYYESSMHITGVKTESGFEELEDLFERALGNSELENEKTTTLEAGYRVRFLEKRLTAEADVFYTQFRNTISFQLGIKTESGFEELEDLFERALGNSELENEKTTTLEAGYRVRFLDKRLTAEADVFYTQFRNTISFQLDIKTDAFGLPDLGASNMNFLNQGREVDSMGGSVSLTYRLNAWRFSANYTGRKSWYIADPPGGPAPTEGSKGERVPWEPAHLFNISLHNVPESGLRFGLALHWHSSCDLAWQEDGSIFGDNILVHSPSAHFISGFLAWRIGSGSWWAEMGVRAFNLLNAGFRDLPAMTRLDDSELGGQLLGRRIFLFFRGSI
jgi:iron complex outermembrane receptor protein